MTEKKISAVSIIRSEYDSIDVGKLLEPLGGLEKWVKKGEKVLLKINMLNGKGPKSAVTTHPSVVRSIGLAVKKAGCVPIIGDSSGGTFSKRRLKANYRSAGYEEISKKYEIPLNFDTSTKKVKFQNGKVLKKTKVCNFALTPDKIIAVPKLKTHSLMYMTLATKIMYGVIPGLAKAKYHAKFPTRSKFAEALIDILEKVPPTLIILDGIVAMEGNGPNSGRPVKLGVMMASTDAVAMDIAVCEMLGLQPVGIPSLKQAKLRGMWPDEIEYPQLSPEDVKVKNFEFPSSMSDLAAKGKGTEKGGKRPRPNEKCIACGECVRICPKDAIAIVRKRAKVEDGECIRCYCCHEICPVYAIDLK